MRIFSTLSALAVSVLLVAGCTGPDVTNSTPPVTPSPSVTDSAPTTEAPVTPTAATSSDAPTPTASQTEVEVPVTEPSGVSPSMTAPTTPPTDTEAATEAWTAMNVVVKEAGDAGKLTGTSADFQAFVADKVSTTDASGCKSEITVTAWNPAGFAFGDDFAPGCGGSKTIWGKSDAGWGVIAAMQGVVPCEEFERNVVPKGVPGLQCVSPTGDVIDY